MTFSNFFSTTSGVLPGAIFVLLETRKICVSTAMVGSPNAMLKTTFAVFRPTPGSASNASRVEGTFEWCLSIIILQVFMMFFAFVLKRPMVFT